MSSASPALDIRGDFQTPLQLARQVWRELGDLGDVGAVVEPTVGTGVFLESAPDCLRKRPWLCFDIEPTHVAATRLVADGNGFTRARIELADAFHLSSDILRGIDRALSILAIGNPPWVTSAGQGGLSMQNLPAKTNADFGLSGLDAMTGKSNFDIGEAILLRLLENLSAFHDVRLAFLIKRNVAMKLARRFLGHAQELSFVRIDAARHFGVAVDAGLFVMRRQSGARSVATHVDVSDELGAPSSKRAGFQNDRFVEDLDAYAIASHLEAVDPVPWRQGVKHDAAKILELKSADGELVNGLGEQVRIEEGVLCPLYKGSDLANDRPPSRLFPLYQFDLSAPRLDLASKWPLLAKYLALHQAAFLARRSRIYAGKHAFAIFGVGPYTLAPWKVAVSGLYSSARFRVLGPSDEGRPPLVDDTCYLLPFDTESDAREVAKYLNSPGPQKLLRALIDHGAKRPVTKAVLARIALPIAPVDNPAAPQLALPMAA